MRLFIGSFATLPLYPLICQRLETVFDARWTEERNLHVTHYFLGEWDSPELVLERLDDFPKLPGNYPIRGLGIFGKKPDILYAGLSSPQLEMIQVMLQELFGRVQQAYVPHVTLCRIRRPIKDGWREELESCTPLVYGTLENRICLLESRPGGEVPAYEILKEL